MAARDCQQPGDYQLEDIAVLAGVRPEDIQLRIHGPRLVVAGVRRDLSIVEGQQSYSMEISYNRFERSVELPCDLGDAQFRSEYRDGMFLVTITIGRPSE